MLLSILKFKKFFLWTFSSILILPDVVRSAPDVVVGEIFLDASTHVDFSSSFYNDIKFFFPNFNPEGFSKFTTPDQLNSTTKRKRSVHWDDSHQLSKKYPVIKWDSTNPFFDADDNDDKEPSNRTTTIEPDQLLTPEDDYPKVSRSQTKPKKKKVYVLAEDDDEDEEDEFDDDLSAPQPLAHQTSPNFPHYGMPPPASPYYQSPNPYYPQPGPYYSPKVSYAKPRKSYDRKKFLQRPPIRNQGPDYHQNERVFDVGLYPKNNKWIKSIFRQGPYYGHGGHGPAGYGAPVEEVEEVKKLPRFLLPWPLGWFIPGPVRRLPTLTLLAFSPIIIIPFVPFGIFELRLPLGWDGNYLAERIYGFEERADTGRGFADDQFDLFNWFDQVVSNTFAINGKTCLQRLICELAEVPIRELSLMGEFIHYIFDPRKGKGKLLKDYQDAEKQGMLYGKCADVYSRCPFSIRRLISEDYVSQTVKRKRK